MAKDTSRKATPRENAQPNQGSVSRAAKKGTALPKRKAVRVAAPREDVMNGFVDSNETGLTACGIVLTRRAIPHHSLRI